MSPSVRIAVLLVPLAGFACAESLGVRVGSRLRVEARITSLADCAALTQEQRSALLSDHVCLDRGDTVEVATQYARTEFRVTERGRDTVVTGIVEIWSGEGEIRVGPCPVDECAPEFLGMALMRVTRSDAECVETSFFRQGPCDAPDGRAIVYSFSVQQPRLFPSLYGFVDQDDNPVMFDVTFPWPSTYNFPHLLRTAWRLERL